MVLSENDRSEKVYPIEVSATKASTNSVEPIKDTTEPKTETETESAQAQLAILMTDTEEKTKKAVDLGTYAAKMAQFIAFDAEAAATEAEREHREIVDSAVQKEEQQLQFIEKYKDKIVSFTSLVITVNDAYEEAKRAAISIAAAKEAWKYAEKKAWLFKTEALQIDGETDTVVAAAEGANIAAKEAWTALSEYRKAVEKVKTAIKNVESKSHKLSLRSLLQSAIEKFKSTVTKAEKEIEKFEAAANLAKDGAAGVAKAWLALRDISKAQTQAAKQKLEKKERKAVDKEGTIQAGQYDFQQQNNQTKLTKSYIYLVSLIIASSIGVAAYIGLTNGVRMQALHVLLRLGYQMLRNFRLGGQPVEGQEALLEAVRPEVVIELADLGAGHLANFANEQANIAINAAADVRQVQNGVVAARGNAAAARQNALARLAEARRGLYELMEELLQDMNGINAAADARQAQIGPVAARGNMQERIAVARRGLNELLAELRGLAL